MSVSWRLVSHKAVRKDLRNIDATAAAHIVNVVLPDIVRDPRLHVVPLRGKLRGLSKRVVHFQGVSYRIVLQIITRSHTVFIVAIGPRGDFYERLARRLK